MEPSASVHARERSEPRVAGLVGAAVASALLYSALLVAPVIGLLPAVVSPFPLILQRLKRGTASAVTALVLADALLAIVFSTGHALAFTLVLAIPGLLIGEAMGRGRGLLRGCGWAFALLATEIGIALFFAGPELGAQVMTPFEQYRSTRFLDELRSRGWPSESVEAWAQQSRDWQQAMEVVYPAVFVISGALLVLLNAWLLHTYLARRDPGWLEAGEFERIRWPIGLAVLFVAGGLAVVSPPLRPAGYNLLLVVAFFFALQGLAVVAFYAHRLAGPPLLRAAVLVLVLVNPWAPQILALLGLFDTWFDFRKWAEPPEAEQG